MGQKKMRVFFDLHVENGMSFDIQKVGAESFDEAIKKISRKKIEKTIKQAKKEGYEKPWGIRARASRLYALDEIIKMAK